VQIMKKLLIVLLLLALVVGAVGWQRGWFSLSTTSQSDQTDVDLHIDRSKIGADADAARERARNLGDSVLKKTQAPGEDKK
jgi:hypothetical protein